VRVRASDEPFPSQGPKRGEGAELALTLVRQIPQIKESMPIGASGVAPRPDTYRRSQYTGEGKGDRRLEPEPRAESCYFSVENTI
jgi:hypothetical protein